MTDLETLTIEDVAALLKLAPKTIRALCKRGELRSLTIARRVRIPRAAVAELLAGPTPPSSATSAPAWPELPATLPARPRPGRPRRWGPNGRTSASSASIHAP